jgi:hypothetical protein
MKENTMKKLAVLTFALLASLAVWAQPPTYWTITADGINGDGTCQYGHPCGPTSYVDGTPYLQPPGWAITVATQGVAYGYSFRPLNNPMSWSWGYNFGGGPPDSVDITGPDGEHFIGYIDGGLGAGGCLTGGGMEKDQIALTIRFQGTWGNGNVSGVFDVQEIKLNHQLQLALGTLLFN